MSGWSTCFAAWPPTAPTLGRPTTGARSTRRAYAGDYARFAQWCAAVGTAAFPASRRGRLTSTITALVADANARGGGTPPPPWSGDWPLSPTCTRSTATAPPPPAQVKVRELMAGIRRTYGKAPAKRDPLHHRPQLAAHGGRGLDLDTVAGKRDRAVLLVGGYARGLPSRRAGQPDPYPNWNATAAATWVALGRDQGLTRTIAAQWASPRLRRLSPVPRGRPRCLAERRPNP